MNIEDLKAFLRKMERMRDEKWLASLSDRKIDELEHHDHQRDSEIKDKLTDRDLKQQHGNKKFYATAQLSDQHLFTWLESNVKGKVFLDYACGAGNNVVRAARNGAPIAIGIDLSSVCFEKAREKAKAHGVEDQCFFVQTDCENTELPNESIDVILCSGVLHHLDLSYAFPEMRRILRKGGKALAVEALNYNPGIKLYRKITPAMRTDWEKEHILGLRDVKFAKHFFDVKNIKHWHLFSIFVAFFRGRGKVFHFFLGFFNKLDRLVLKIPGVRLLSWQFSFELHKASKI